MIKTIKLYINKCTFMFPFLLGALFCSLWGGFFNLLTFLFIGYVGVQLIKHLTKPTKIVVEA